MPRIAPGLAGAIVSTGNEAHRTRRGWVVPPHITLTAEQMESLRAGWLCPECWTTQDEAMPEVCKTAWRDTGERCGFRFREELHRWLEAHFRGEEDPWPDRLDEIEAEREQEMWTPRNGVYVPNTLN